MILDIILLLFVAVGFYRGFRNGIIYSVFSLVGFFAGIIAALKFSFILTNLLRGWVHLGPRAPAIISFVVVFALVVGLFLLLAWALEQILKTFLLNLPNKIIGGIIYAFIGLYLFCVLVWYAKKMDAIPVSQQKGSLTYAYINELAPQVINATGKVLPFVKDTFKDLEDLFGKG